MAQGVLMPKEGITVESCVMGEWKKEVGDTVAVGDVLFSYETDKAEFECTSTAAGTLLAKFYEEGDEVPCLINVCAVGNPGEDYSALQGNGGAAAAEAPAAAAPVAAAPAAAPVAAAPAAAPVGGAQGVIMPKEGITVESCIMGEWQKEVGDTVAVGDVLFSYETDKAEFECTSTAAGTLLAKFYEAGDEVPCLLNVCAVGNPGEAFEHLRGIGGTPAATEAPAAAPAAAAPAAAVAAGPMAQAVIMPKEGITVESCIIGEWQKEVGDTVAVGDVLFTYETDKAEFECTSTAAGTLLARFYENGDEVPCLLNVCAVGKAGEEYECLRGVSGQPAVVAAAPAAAEDTSNDGSPVSPRARALAKNAGINPNFAKGTGPNGRIIERDVQKLIDESVPAQAAVVAAPVVEAPAAAPVAAAPVAAAAEEYTDVKFNGVRRATSKSMMTSLSTMAQLTQQFSFDATQIQAYRKMLKAMDGPMGKISLNDMVMFAVSRTVLSCPDLNANMLEENVVRQFHHVNLGFACDTPKGLLVPIIEHADEKSLLEISMELKDLAAQAKDGKLPLDKMSGGTFTVSNIGSFGCEAFTPVINPPQTGILGVCNIQTKIKAVNGDKIETYPAMGLSLTFDHRVVDGAPAARFMAELCKNLENFFTLLAK